MAEPLRAADSTGRRLVLRIGAQDHAVDAGTVLEIIRAPRLTRVPGAPFALAGIANLRGRPLTVVSVAHVLGAGGPARGDGGKILVCDRNGLVGLLVDDVLSPSDMRGASALSMDELYGKIEAAFGTAGRTLSGRTARSAPDAAPAPPQRLEAFLSFRVAGQLYGLPLASIHAVKAVSDTLTPLADAAEGMIGFMAGETGTLPLVLLSALLGLDGARQAPPSRRVVVIAHRDARIGLVVDAIDAIYRLADDAIDAVPPVLQRGAGEARIDGIGRIRETGALMSILSPERLWHHRAVSQALERKDGTDMTDNLPRPPERFEPFLIFRLGAERYGLPVAAVDEIMRVPGTVTRMPGAPAFVAGVVNLRGRALPLIDQRIRFEAPEGGASLSPRAIVLTIGALQAGFIVDEVSEVVPIASASISPAPDFSAGDTDIFDRVAHIGTEDRMVLLVDPKALLNKAEHDVLSALAKGGAMAGDGTMASDP